jgi:hypothetical protein
MEDEVRKIEELEYLINLLNKLNKEQLIEIKEYLFQRYS